LRSLREVHELNTYRAGNVVCPSVSPYVSTPEVLEKLGLNFVWRLHQWVLLWNPTFQFLTIGNNKVADEETCEARSTLAPIAIGSYNDVWF
jgi:hypothetical protein